MIKKLILITLVLFTFTLSLKTIDVQAIETPFVATEILPATTELKIGWALLSADTYDEILIELNSTDFIGFDLTSEGSLGYINPLTSEYVAKGRFVFVFPDTVWQGADVCGYDGDQTCTAADGFFIIDTSAWSEAMRTISAVSAVATTSGLYYEDVYVRPTSNFSQVRVYREDVDDTFSIIQFYSGLIGDVSDELYIYHPLIYWLMVEHPDETRALGITFVRYDDGALLDVAFFSWAWLFGTYGLEYDDDLIILRLDGAGLNIDSYTNFYIEFYIPLESVPHSMIQWLRDHTYYNYDYDLILPWGTQGESRAIFYQGLTEYFTVHFDVGNIPPEPYYYSIVPEVKILLSWNLSSCGDIIGVCPVGTYDFDTPLDERSVYLFNDSFRYVQKPTGEMPDLNLPSPIISLFNSFGINDTVGYFMVFVVLSIVTLVVMLVYRLPTFVISLVLIAYVAFFMFAGMFAVWVSILLMMAGVIAILLSLRGGASYE